MKKKKSQWSLVANDVLLSPSIKKKKKKNQKSREAMPSLYDVASLPSYLFGRHSKFRWRMEKAGCHDAAHWCQLMNSDNPLSFSQKLVNITFNDRHPYKKPVIICSQYFSTAHQKRGCRTIVFKFAPSQKWRKEQLAQILWKLSVTFLKLWRNLEPVIDSNPLSHCWTLCDYLVLFFAIS